MNTQTHSKTRQGQPYCRRVARSLIAGVTLMLVSLTIEPAAAATEDEVRATF
jgi:hypothetical protein